MSAPSTQPGRHRAAGRPVILPRGPLVVVKPLPSGGAVYAAYLGGEHRAETAAQVAA